MESKKMKDPLGGHKDLNLKICFDSEVPGGFGAYVPYPKQFTCHKAA